MEYILNKKNPAVRVRGERKRLVPLRFFGWGLFFCLFWCPTRTTHVLFYAALPTSWALSAASDNFSSPSFEGSNRASVYHFFPFRCGDG